MTGLCVTGCITASFPAKPVLGLLRVRAPSLPPFFVCDSSRQLVPIRDKTPGPMHFAMTEPAAPPNLEQIKQCLLEQCEEVGSRLRQEKLAARTVQLKLRYTDFTTLTRRKG